MANYGIPYMGSKNTIATWVVDHIPACDNLYELFAGGCAVTHAAILSGKFKNIYKSSCNNNEGKLLACLSLDFY